mgnify:CR=1 FL=1
MSTVDRIFALLKKNHLNAKTVATAVGIPPSNFTEWKKGRSKPSSDSLRLLADYFGVSVDYLLGRVEAPDDFFTVAANRCRDSLREAKRHPRVSMDELSGLGAEREDLGVLEALMALPEKFRLVLTLHYVEGYSTAEIAAMIGRTPSAVKMRLKKGRALLENELGKERE